MRADTKKETILYYIILALISVGALMIWRFISASAGIQDLLNIDDLASIQFAMAGDDYRSMIYEIVKNDPTNVPIFYILLRSWITWFGYEPNILRIVPEIAASLVVFLSGVIGKKVKDKKLGLVCAVIAATSIQIIYVSFQIRAYSLLVLGASILLLAWLYRSEKWKTQIFYVLALWFLSFSHFYGVLFCFAFGLWDLVRVLKRKSKLFILLPYVVYGAVFFPYLIISFISANDMYGAFWPPVPNYLDLFKMIEQLSPLDKIGVVIFFISTVYVLISVINREKPRFEVNVDNIIEISVWSVWIVLIIGFIYSRYINPISSVWVYRYFLVVYPCLILVVGFGIYQLILYVARNLKLSSKMLSAILIALGIVYSYQGVEYGLKNKHEINTGGAEYKAVADYLRIQEDIKSEKTLIYFPYPELYFVGWIEFYSQGDIENLPNMCCTVNELSQLDLSQYETIYTVGLVYDLSTQGQVYIDEKFDLSEGNCNGIKFLNRYVRR